jgi:hypothetical protein
MRSKPSISLCTLASRTFLLESQLPADTLGQNLELDWKEHSKDDASDRAQHYP